MRWTVAVLALVPAACAQESDVPLARATTTTTREAASDELQLLWSTEDIRFVSMPVGLDDVVVAYLAEDSALFLAGYDSETGEELWRRPSTASDSTAGVVIEPVVGSENVVHLAPGEAGDLVEAVDVATGEPVWTSQAAPDGFNDQVRFCDPSRDTVCTSAGDAGLWELDADTGELLTPSGLVGRPRQEGIDGRQLGPGIYELFDSGDIALVEDGQVVWQRPPSELFGGHEVNPDWGWYFRDADDLVVGWLGSQPLPENGEFELVPQYTAGIDRATGETRWLEEGALTCGLDDLALQVGGDDPWLRCRSDGTVAVEDYDVVEAEGTTEMAGFDPASGAADWTVDLGGLPAYDVEQVTARLDPTSFAMALEGGDLVAVDVSDGTVLDVTTDDVGWCIGYNEYEYDGSRYDFRVGESFHTPCNLAGERQELPAEADEAMGIVLGDVFVWMDEVGLHGARVPD